MQVKSFLKFIESAKNKVAIVCDEDNISYSGLYENILHDCKFLDKHGVKGAGVLLADNYSISSISMLFALWMLDNVVALTSLSAATKIKTLADDSGVKFIIKNDGAGEKIIIENEPNSVPPNVYQLLSLKQAGFIVFSSGSTGPSKGVVHRITPFFERYLKSEKCGAMLAFLLFDHIGGLVTVFQVLATHGTLVLPRERSPEEVGRCVEHFNVETLHVSPTLLNLSLISGVFRRSNIKSLKRIYYGSEPISYEVLKRIKKNLPDVELKQLYGMSEIGVLPCDSKQGDSRWMRMDDQNYSVKVVDGILHVRGKTTMVGYLSDLSSLPENTYFNTEDLAEENDGYFKIKGRAVDLINVGGSNVYPIDVERVLEELDNVVDVVVYGEENPILGEVVAARFVLENDEVLGNFKIRMHKEIKGILPPEQIPRIISISKATLYTNRFKKIRKVKEVVF